MNKKHREAFVDLKSLCDKHGIKICADTIFFYVPEYGPTQYFVREVFDKDTHLVVGPGDQHHSISSEGADE